MDAKARHINVDNCIRVVNKLRVDSNFANFAFSTVIYQG